MARALNVALMVAYATGLASQQAWRCVRHHQPRHRVGHCRARGAEVSTSNVRAAQRHRLSLEEVCALATAAQEETRLQACRADLRRELGRAPGRLEWAARAVPGGDVATLIAARRRARQAKDTLVEANAGLVKSIARSYVAYRPHLPLEDLVQEGVVGLMRAVDKYDVSLGYKFSTYANLWVRASISEWIRNADAIVVPRRVRAASTKALKAGVELQAELGRDPTTAEVGARIGVAKEQIEVANEAKRNTAVFSYDVTTAVSRGSGVEGSYVTDMADDSTATADFDRRADLLAALEAALLPRELDMLRLRYGLDDGNQRSTRECAVHLGIGKETVRQICIKAFSKLRDSECSEELQTYIDS